MKKNSTLTISSLMTVFFLLTGCGKVLDYRNAEISNNKVYENGKNTPFSGKVTNFPIKNLPVERLSEFARIVYRDTVTPEGILMPTAASVVTQSVGSNTVFCDLSFDDGIVDGRVLCKKPNSETPLLDFKYKKGTIDGDVIFYHFVNTNEVHAKAKFKEGSIEGESYINSFETGKVIHKINWANGITQGVEELFDKTTGALVRKSNFINGKLDGEVVVYTEDGRTVTAKGNYKNGLQDGVFEVFDRESGKLIEKSVWKNGAGVSKESIQSNLSPASATNNTKSDECVSLWTTAFRKEVGDDVLITTDQIGEWEASCKEGRKPN